nr:ribonuclease H-like domain-containing protein [Tanacetum cinerariifolium]
MDQQYPTVAKIPVLDTKKFEQWKFRIQQYLQHEHYALWEVIEFGDSYTVPANSPSTTTTDTTSGEAGTKSGRTVTLSAEDMQKKKNDQYGNFKAKGSETLEQTFNRLQVMIDTACAYIASQSSGSKVKDVNQIDEDDMEEMDIKWNMSLLSMRAAKFWKKTGKKISIQRLDVAGFDKSKDRGRRENYIQGSKAEE